MRTTGDIHTQIKNISYYITPHTFDAYVPNFINFMETCKTNYFSFKINPKWSTDKLRIQSTINFKSLTYITVWKSSDFSATHILSEIDFSNIKKI